MKHANELKFTNEWHLAEHKRSRLTHNNKQACINKVALNLHWMWSIWPNVPLTILCQVLFKSMKTAAIENSLIKNN